MSKYFIVASFNLRNGKLEEWIELSKKIDEYISKAKGFISRDSGIDDDNKIYCLVKWESKAHQESFRKELESREDWGDMMAYFGSLVDVESAQYNRIELFD